MIRGINQGQDWTEDVAHVLARIWHDTRDGSGRKPAALVVAALDAGGVLDALRGLPPTRVGVKPQARAA